MSISSLVQEANNTIQQFSFVQVFGHFYRVSLATDVEEGSIWEAMKD